MTETILLVGLPFLLYAAVYYDYHQASERLMKDILEVFKDDKSDTWIGEWDVREAELKKNAFNSFTNAFYFHCFVMIAGLLDWLWSVGSHWWHFYHH